MRALSCWRACIDFCSVTHTNDSIGAGLKLSLQGVFARVAFSLQIITSSSNSSSNSIMKCVLIERGRHMWCRCDAFHMSRPYIFSRKRSRTRASLEKKLVCVHRITHHRALRFERLAQALCILLCGCSCVRICLACSLGTVSPAVQAMSVPQMFSCRM